MTLSSTWVFHQYICAGARVHKKAALTPKRNKATAAVPA